LTDDQGRFEVTGQQADRGRFKTPSLRNVALRQRFFHTGTTPTLQGVFGFYDAGGGAFNQNKDPLLAGINVPFPIRASLESLLNALTDPRVAAETFPFDRPTLRSEQAVANPLPLGVGAVAGTGGFVPQIVADTPPREGHEGFRIGVHGALGGQFSVLHVQLLNVPGTATVADLRNGLPLAQVLSGAGAGAGYGTWYDLDATAPSLVGLSFDAQWWIRDLAAPGGIAKSDVVRVTIEPR